MSEQYIPLGRDFELRMRAECPKYRAVRKNAADEWREMRRRYGADLTRMHWRHLADMRKTITDNILYSSTPGQFGLGRLLSDAD